MKLDVEYYDSDLKKGKCTSCGEKTEVLNEFYDESRFRGMCPGCASSILFEEYTTPPVGWMGTSGTDMEDHDY